nr:transposase [Aurantimonas aggregata]
MAGQIVDASLVPAPKQRNTEGEKAAIKAGKCAREIWPNEPAKAAQKDVDARWTLKIGGKVRYRPDGTPLPMIAAPVFGYKSHISIDQRFGFIRESAVTSAAAPDGWQLRHLVSRESTGSQVWADSAYRSGENEKWLAERMLSSRIHRRKPAGKSMPRAMAKAEARDGAQAYESKCPRSILTSSPAWQNATSSLQAEISSGPSNSSLRNSPSQNGTSDEASAAALIWSPYPDSPNAPVGPFRS